MAKKNFKGGLGGILGNNSASLELTILPELKSFIPPLTDEERKLLKESIEKDGVKEPLDIWLNEDKAIIIDGHNRYSIATELNAKYTTTEHDFASIQDVKDWMLKKQLGRRNLTDANRKYLIGLLYQGTKIDKGQFGSKKSTNAAEVIAEQTGSSVRTVKNAGEFAEGMDKLSLEFKTHVLEGKAKVNQKDIQALSSSEVEKPIENIEQVSQEVQKVEKKKESKKKKAAAKKDDMPFTPIEDFQKQYDKTGSEEPGKASNEPKKDELSEIERFELYSKTKDKFVETFGDLDNEILISVLNDMLALRGSMSDNMKLANDGYTILRTADTPSIHIKHFSTDKNSWKTLENGFTSKAKRDKRFRELLQDSKTIQG